jgi:seryl-tRNA synthetase
MLAANQRNQELKFELLVQIAGSEPTAVSSFNYHQEHFAAKYGLTLADGNTAHTACLGFGQERIVLALLHTHGLEPAAWPAAVRGKLWPE